VDLARDQYIVEASYYDQDGKKVVVGRDLALPVLLPFDVARQLAEDITSYRSMRANLMGQDGPVGAASSDQIEDAKRYAFSHALDAIVRHPDFKDDVEDDFAVARLAIMRGNMSAHEAGLARLELAVEATAGDLTRWLDRKLMRILIDGCEPSDEHRLLEMMNEILPSLQESAVGASHLQKALRFHSKRGFYERYFERGKSLGDLETSTVKKARAGPWRRSSAPSAKPGSWTTRRYAQPGFASSTWTGS
jgi:hypothetical protein